MGMYGSASDGGAAANEAARQAAIQQGIGNIDSSFAGFNQDFYKQRAKDYLKVALPQYSTQLQDTKNTLANSLARRGLLQSGAAIKAGQSLTRYAQDQQRQISDTATGQANQLRSEVQNQKQNLYSQVEASADPTLASNSAIGEASVLRQPANYGSLGQMFGDWTNAYRANQVAQAYNPNVQDLMAQFSFGNPQQQPTTQGSSYIKN